MMGEKEVTDQENEKEARARFTSNYYSRGGTDPAWLAENIEPLIRIAVPAPRTPHPSPVRLKVGADPQQPHSGRVSARLKSLDQFIDHYTAPEPELVGAAHV